MIISLDIALLLKFVVPYTYMYMYLQKVILLYLTPLVFNWIWRKCTDDAGGSSDFNHLRLCLATAIYNLKWLEITQTQYMYLFNLRQDIYKSWYLNTHFIPNINDLICK